MGQLHIRERTRDQMLWLDRPSISENLTHLGCERAGRKQTLNPEFILILNFLLNFVFHFYYLLFFTFYFEIILALEKNWKNNSVSLHIPFISCNVSDLYNQSIFIKTRKLTLVQYCSLNYRPYSNFSFPLSFSVPGSNSCSCVVASSP